MDSIRTPRHHTYHLSAAPGGRYLSVELSYGDVHESQQQSLVIDRERSSFRWTPMTQQVVFDHGTAIGIRHLPPGSDAFSEVIAMDVASGALHTISRSPLPYPLALRGNIVGNGRDFVALAITEDWRVHFVCARTLEVTRVIEIRRGLSAIPLFEGAIRGTHDGRLLIRRERSVDLYREVSLLDGPPERSWDAGELITHWSVSVNDDHFALVTEEATPADAFAPGDVALLVGCLDEPGLVRVESPQPRSPLITRDDLFVDTSTAWYRRVRFGWEKVMVDGQRVAAIVPLADGTYLFPAPMTEMILRARFEGERLEFDEVVRFQSTDDKS